MTKPCCYMDALWLKRNKYDRRRSMNSWQTTKVLENFYHTFTQLILNLMNPESCNIWEIYKCLIFAPFIDIWYNLRRNILDIFDIQSISEKFNHDAINVKSSLVSLVTGHCVPWLHANQNEMESIGALELLLSLLITGHCVSWLHVKKTRIGVDKWARIGDFPPLYPKKLCKYMPHRFKCNN